MALNALAWQILSMPTIDDAKRDTEIALKAADKANTETNGEDPMVLDTYALALFQNDRVPEAVATQQKAIDLAAGNERMQADMKTRLEEFKAALESANKGNVTPNARNCIRLETKKFQKKAAGSDNRYPWQLSFKPPRNY
ncbi:MAG: hypothetical protein ACYS9H_07800 [Planctomycetota bacterium]|jgi:hypothetical protein